MREEQVRMIASLVLERLSPLVCGEELEVAVQVLASGIVLGLERDEERKLGDTIVRACARLGDLGFFTGSSGNASARCTDERFLITPSGLYKGALRREELVMVDSGGSIIGGRLKPTSELKMHLAVYAHRTDVSGVVHAHPPYATGFAAARVSLDRDVLPEAILILGKIPLVDYSTPSTSEVPDNLTPHLKSGNAFLLANHGALTLGRTLEEAAHRMETLELYAKVLLISRILGGEKLLNEDELKRLAAAHP